MHFNFYDYGVYVEWDDPEGLEIMISPADEEYKLAILQLYEPEDDMPVNITVPREKLRQWAQHILAATAVE